MSVTKNKFDSLKKINKKQNIEMNFSCKFLFIIACMNNRIIKMVDGREFHETKMMTFLETNIYENEFNEILENMTMWWVTDDSKLFSCIACRLH